MIHRASRAWVLVVAVAVMVAADGCTLIGRPAGPTPTVRATGTVASTGTDASPESQEQIFAAKRGITLAEAKRRLGWQVVAPDLVGRLDQRPFFAGVWIDVRGGDRVKVGVAGRVTAEAAAEIKRDALAVGLTEGYDVVVRRFPLRALDEANDWLGSQLVLVNAGAPATLIAGLRTDLNVVDLQAPTGGALTPAQASLLAQARTRLGDRLVVSTYTRRFVALNCMHSQCDPPLRGGARIRYFNNGDFEFCTGGFTAKGTADQMLYLITAGHCLADHHDVDWTAPYADGTQHVVGPVRNYQFSDEGDYGILQITNVSGWNPQAWVSLWYDLQGDQVAFNITSDNYSVLGMTVCHGGAESGSSTCGEVTELGVTATYNGVTVKDLGRASYCAAPGDSGAPVFLGHIAYGMTTAGNIDAKCDVLYQGIRAVESAVRVDVLHASEFPEESGRPSP